MFRSDPPRRSLPVSSLDRAYPGAPVSSLYLHDKVQDMAFELDEGRSADKRHHVRFWQIAPNDWLAAATFDRGVGLSLFTLQITHYIGSDPDRDRVLVGDVSAGRGCRATRHRYVENSTGSVASQRWRQSLSDRRPHLGLWVRRSLSDVGAR